MKGYKGFDKDFKCNGFQYEVGKEYIIDGDIKLCSKGFHFCKSPLNVWAYYPQVKGSRYAIIEAEDVLRDKDGDTKRVCKKIKIVKELTALELIEEQIKYAKDKKSNTGSYSSASNTGNYSSASNTGNYGIAVAWGKESKAKGKKGNYIVISEWSFQDGERILICAKMVKVDGKKIKEDVYYTLKGGKVVEVK